LPVIRGGPAAGTIGLLIAGALSPVELWAITVQVIDRPTSSAPSA
jgi:hypothetical protein